MTTHAIPQRGRKADPNSKSGQIRALLATGMSVGDIAKRIGCTTALAYNVKAKMNGPKKRGPGRPAKATATKAPRASATTLATAGLDGILAAVKGAEKQRVKMRTALEKIQAVLAEALA